VNLSVLGFPRDPRVACTTDRWDKKLTIGAFRSKKAAPIDRDLNNSLISTPASEGTRKYAKEHRDPRSWTGRGMHERTGGKGVWPKGTTRIKKKKTETIRHHTERVCNSGGGEGRVRHEWTSHLNRQETGGERPRTAGGWIWAWATKTEACSSDTEGGGRGGWGGGGGVSGSGGVDSLGGGGGGGGVGGGGVGMGVVGGGGGGGRGGGWDGGGGWGAGVGWGAAGKGRGGGKVEWGGGAESQTVDDVRSSR